jgi:hypothetical protein
VQQTAGLSRDGGRTAAVVWRLLADRVLHAATPDTGEGTRKQWAWSAANTRLCSYRLAPGPRAGPSAQASVGYGFSGWLART